MPAGAGSVPIIPSIKVLHIKDWTSTMPDEPRAEYDRIVAELTATTPSSSAKMFGMPCIKNDLGKAFGGFYQDSMVFKLRDPQHAEALGLAGAQLFDPSGQGRPMKDWVQVPAKHAAHWPGLARDALEYVNSSGKRR